MPTPRIFITGGAGFIGTHLCEALRKKGWKVSVLDLQVPTRAITGVEYHRGDILDAEKLGPLVAECDGVVHLAAKVSVPLCEADPVGSHETNFVGTIRVADAIAIANSGRPVDDRIALHFASSAAVYGALSGDGLIDEERASLAPLSNYARQKRSVEVALGLRVKEIPSWSFRFFNVFGPGQDPNSPYSGVISIFSERLKRGQPLELYGDGGQTRDFISVYDVVSGLVRALELPSSLKDGRPINLCTGTRTTIRELGDLIARITGNPLVWNSKSTRVGDIRDSCGDPSRAHEILGWVPQVQLESGLRDLLG